MGLIESDHPDVPAMKGLHLFHFMLSNCSQRARLGLEEKGLTSTSHHLNLPGNEHVTSDYQRIEASSAFQPAFKVLSHELLFRPFRVVSADELALYEQRHSDRKLVAFLRDYAENGAAWKGRVRDAQRELDATLDGLEAALEDSSWLSGDDYGLADISWVVNAHRLNQARVDLGRWPKFQDWSERAMARPAFDRAVASYQP